MVDISDTESVRNASPSRDLSPEEVVRLQVKALSLNSEIDGEGIEVAYAFASPANKQNTGPLPRFRRMVRGQTYNTMLGSDSASYRDMQKGDEEASQVVELTKNGERAIYEFRISEQSSGPREGCWLTDSVIRLD